MAVSSTRSKVVYIGDGKVTRFSIPFQLHEEDNSDLFLFTVDPAGTMTQVTTGYQVSPDKTIVTYPITLDPENPPSPLALDWYLVIMRKEDITQSLDLTEQGYFSAEALEKALDKLTFICQQLNEEVARAIKLPPTVEDTSIDILAEVYRIEANVASLESRATSAAILAEASSAEALNSEVIVRSIQQAVSTQANKALVDISNSRVSALQAIDTKVNTALTTLDTLLATSTSAITSARESAITTITNLSQTAQTEMSRLLDQTNQAKNAAKQSELNAKAAEVSAGLSERGASIYAASAFGASAPAYSSTEEYNFPQCVAYTDGFTYRCIGTSVVGGNSPNASTQWVRITMQYGDPFELDEHGDLMPMTSPVYSEQFSTDENGDLFPV